MTARLDDLRKSFQRELRAAGRAARTITLYGECIESFTRWLTAEGRPTTLDELTRTAIREWLATLTDSGFAPGTVKMRFRGVYRFCVWLVDEGELAEHPMLKLMAPRPPEVPVPLVSDDDLIKLLKSCMGRSFAERRDQAMFRVLLDTGMRVGELCAMTTDEDRLNLDKGTAMVTGKTGTRYVYFSDRTIRALDRYLRMREKHRWSSLPSLWLGERGATTVDGVRETLRKRCGEAGIRRINPHRFRHTWAADFLANGGQERDAMRLAGWKSETMLGRYGSATADARAEAAARRMKRGDRV